MKISKMSEVEMKKSKMSDVVDRLSTLPDSLIFHIYWLMPMRDVVKTSVLSKRWKNLWTTSPYLNFKFYSKYKVTDRIRKFVNRALIAWRGRGIKILKFRISFDSIVKKSLYSDIDLWLAFAIENGVEELYLEFMYEEGEYIDGDMGLEVEAYLVPQFLYSCSSLKALSLKCCNLQINGNVLWNSLKVLDIEGYSMKQHSIDRIVSGSPQLESFLLSFIDSKENLSIRSTSLKKLSIEKYLPRDMEEPSMDTELTICSPNLEILEITGLPYSKSLFVDVSALKLSHATLWMFGHYLFSGDDFIGETLRQILPTIKYVESFTIADWSLKVLGDMKKKGLLSPFPNVKSLLLNVGFEEYEQIVGLLEIFPKLKGLVIQDVAHVPCHELLKLNTDLPESFLLQLRTVDVTWTKGNNIFPFIEILLKYASKLERMVFRVKCKTPSNSLLLASQKLLRMKRSSTNVELSCC